MKNSLSAKIRTRHFARNSLAIALAALTFAAPIAQAATLSQAVADCRKQVDAHNDAVNANAALRTQQQMDSYLKEIAHAPVPTKQSGSGGDNFDCHDITQDAFNDILSQASGLFGSYGSLFTSIMGSAAGSASSSLCGAAQSAAGNLYQKVTVQCPDIEIPGMPIECNGKLGVSTGGVTYSGSGTVGGASGSQSGTFGGGIMAAKAPSGGSLVSKFSCWLSNSC